MFDAKKSETKKLSRALDAADFVVVGAGAGLSASAGFSYSGDRFTEWCKPWEDAFDVHDFYSAGFYPFPTSEEFWGYWSAMIMANRYECGVGQVYRDLLELLSDKDYFVLTTNVDHQFQLAGFDKKRLYYTQGDYGLFQCSRPCCQETYDNEELVRAMYASLCGEEAHSLADGQGRALVDEQRSFSADGGAASSVDGQGGSLIDGRVVGRPKHTAIPIELIPRCPHCGAEMTTNLRCDERFVEDEGWHVAAERYYGFIRRSQGCKVLFLELGVGYNTPGIIKYPFWQMTSQNLDATYACVNLGQSMVPPVIESQSITIDADISQVVSDLLKMRKA